LVGFIFKVYLLFIIAAILIMLYPTIKSDLKAEIEAEQKDIPKDEVSDKK